MLNIFNFLTTRESIIYFIQKYSNGKLNKNCNDIKFYEKRNCGFIYDDIINYFDDENLKKLNLTQKYYHIYHNIMEYYPNNKFINFYSGYVGIPKKILLDKNKIINFDNVDKLKFSEIYSLDKTKNKLINYNFNKIYNKIHTFPDKKLLYSIYQHTYKYKNLPLLIRVKYIKGILNDSDLVCSYCGSELKFCQKLRKTCGDNECYHKFKSNLAKEKNDLNAWYSEESNNKKIKSRIGRKHSESTKIKIRESNDKVWTEEFKIKDRKIRLEKNVAQKIYNTLKNKILKGEYTPKSENRKRSKRIKSDITGIQYRSNWELIFHEKNPELLYEYTRIKYIEMEKERVYITDFTDQINKIVYEIKPNSELKNKNFLIKTEFAKKWCEENGYKFEIVTESDYMFYGRKIK